MEQLSETVSMNDFPEWTVADFDAIQENHVFSNRYRRAMRKTVRHYRRSFSRRPSFPVAATAVTAGLVLPVFVFAAVMHEDFFQNVFGDSVRKSIEAHTETYDDGEGGQYSVTYPLREIIPVDADAAEALVGEAVFEGPLSVTVGDHVLTVDSAVRDKNAIVLEFTITCDSDVRVFDVDDLSNEAKGPNLAEDAAFRFCVDGAAEMIYVDTKQSDGRSLHGYYYGLYVFDGPLADGETPVLKIFRSIDPANGLWEKEPLQAEIPASKAVAMTAFTSGTGGVLELSPFSLQLDLAKGLGLYGYAVNDPANLKTLSIEFSDGSVYQVLDKGRNIENTSYICGGGKENSSLSMIFNRLIDPSDITKVIVNGIEYTEAH